MALSAKQPKSRIKVGMVLVVLFLVAAMAVLLLTNYLRVKSLQNDSLRVVKDTPTSSVMPAKAKPGIPQRLTIPIINLDTVIERVGLTPNGDLDAPKIITNTGWYQEGVRPGEAGSAVIDGHYGWLNGNPAIFNDLNKLKKGDGIYVKDEAGVNTKFIVRGSRLYAPDENAAAVFHSDNGEAYLNLITCQGEWESGQQSYSQRLVVFAEKEPSSPRE